MSLFTKIKGLFTETTLVKQQITPRAARLTATDITGETEVKLKKWVKATLGTAPWAALAIILFGMFSTGAIATAALGYGLMKMAIAVLVTVIADETMFNGQATPQETWVPMTRRAAVFLGVCWMLAVT